MRRSTIALIVILAACIVISGARAGTGDLYALAQPVTTVNVFTIECVPMPDWLLGQTYPTGEPPAIQLNKHEVCRAIRRLENHADRNGRDRLVDTFYGLMTLTHEAFHVRQGVEAIDPYVNSVYNEHAAECGGLAALPAALRSLNYQARFIRNAMWFSRKYILREEAPYGGVCP